MCIVQSVNQNNRLEGFLKRISSWWIIAVLFALLICRDCILLAQPYKEKMFSFQHPILAESLLIIDYAFIWALWIKLFLFTRRKRSGNKMMFFISAFCCSLLGLGFMLLLLVSPFGLLQAIIVDVFVLFALMIMIQESSNYLKWMFGILFIGMCVYLSIRIGMPNHPDFLTSLYTDIIVFRTIWSWDNFYYLWFVRYSLTFLYATCIYSVIWCADKLFINQRNK